MGNPSLENRVIAVTGGSSGIGLGIVKLLLSMKAKVAIADLQPPPKEIADSTDTLYTKVDVAYKQQVADWVKELVSKFGRLDGMCANAGITPWEGGLGVTSNELYDLIFDVCTRGVWNCGTEAYLQFERQGSGGVIVNTASSAGVKAFPGMPVYCGAKHAVVGFTKSWATTWGAKGIRVNAIAPGFIETPEQKKLFKDYTALEGAPVAVPLGRIGQPGDIADTVAYLLGDASAFITGQVLCVDGGGTA